MKITKLITTHSIFTCKLLNSHNGPDPDPAPDPAQDPAPDPQPLQDSLTRSARHGSGHPAASGDAASRRRASSCLHCACARGPGGGKMWSWILLGSLDQAHGDGLLGIKNYLICIIYFIKSQLIVVMYYYSQKISPRG